MNLMLMGPRTWASVSCKTLVVCDVPLGVRMISTGDSGTLLYLACDFVLRGSPYGIVHAELDDERARRTSVMIAELEGLGLTDIEEM